MKRGIKILLFLLIFLLATPIGASAATLDGLEITTKTDQAEYEDYESISVTHTIKNTNDTTVTNLTLENQLPEGYTADKKTPLSTTIEALEPGESIRFSTTLDSEIPKPKVTGNTALTVILFCLGGLVIAGGGAAVTIIIIQNTKKKKAGQVLSILLCVAMLGAMVAPVSADQEQSKLDLTHDVTVDGAAMTLHTLLTYDPIPGEKVNLAVEATNMLFDVASRVYHVVEEMNGLTGTLLYTDKATEGECEVKDVNGNLLMTRKFKPANIWKIDDFGLIVGLNHVRVSVSYEDGMVYETKFQINNICEKNMDCLNVDKGDSDEDGVLNFIENMYHTDPNNSDSDGDTLPDYEEMAILGTDVMNPDTDDNGVIDADEDTDGDGLTNGQEILEYLTDSILVDSDGDALSDYDEIHTYLTGPNVADTDGDGKDDGWELANGYDPLTVNTDFPPEEILLPDNMDVESDGEVVITPLEDDLLINENTPGYIGVDPVHVELEEGHTADISMEFDPSQITDEEDPTLYYFDEETQNYEEVPSTVSGDKVEATIQKSGVYVLLNHRFVEDVWANDIFKPSEMTDGNIDVVFVVDRSKSMDENDPNAIRKDVTKQFIGKLRSEQDQAALVQFTTIAEVIMPLTNDREALCNTVDMIENSDGGGCEGTDEHAGTNGSAGIRAAITLLDESNATYKYIIFLTDGEDTTVSEDYGDAEGTYGLTGEARQKGIIIHTVGLVGYGGVDTDLLKRVAHGTGGNYYLASVGEDAENNSELVAIYDEIESVTIDRHLDSNNDGISDYYTRLICDGKLGTGTGVRNLFGDAEYDDVQANADFDGDGLLNGQELEIIENDRGVFVKVISMPYTEDSDMDGLSDYKEQNGTTSPLKKNGNVLQSDVAWLTNSENFESHDYLKLYNENVLVRGAVTIGNAFFGTTLDQTNLYRQVLLDYFYDIDQTLLSSNSEATFNAYVEAFNEAVCSEMEAGLIALLESDDPDAVEQELKKIYDFVDDLSDIHDSADHTKLNEFILELINKPAKAEKADIEKMIGRLKNYMDEISYKSPNLTPDFKNAKLDELTKKVNDYISDSRILKGKIKGRTDIFKKIGKAADVIGKVMFVIDVAQDSWKAHQDVCNTIAALDTIEGNLYILECIIANSHNSYLTGAAKDIRFYLNETFSDQVTEMCIAMDRANSVITGATLELVHDVIAGAGIPGAIIEVIRIMGNLVFNLDEISKAAAETVALAASADILGENYLDHLKGGYAIKQDDLWVAYANYSDNLYISILNLAKLRNHAERKMASWKKDDTVVANCNDNADRCNQLDNLYNVQYYMMFLS